MFTDDRTPEQKYQDFLNESAEPEEPDITLADCEPTPSAVQPYSWKPYMVSPVETPEWLLKMMPEDCHSIYLFNTLYFFLRDYVFDRRRHCS